jgi:hypothetical protein
LIESRILQFVLATTGTRTLDDPERIQHTLTVYQRIRQPEIWAQWVRNQVDAFEQGNITLSQSFMNTAVIKYNKICTFLLVDAGHCDLFSP